MSLPPILFLLSFFAEQMQTIVFLWFCLSLGSYSIPFSSIAQNPSDLDHYLIYNGGGWRIKKETEVWARAMTLNKMLHALAGWFSWLEHHPIHWNTVGSIPSRGTYVGWGFNPRSRCVQSQLWACALGNQLISLSPSLSLSLSLSLSRALSTQ